MRDTANSKVSDSSSEGDVSPDVSQLSLNDQERCYRWRRVRHQKGTEFPRSRSKHALCMVGDYVYVYGGKDVTISLKDFWRYNIFNGVWECVTYRGEKLPHLEDFTIVSSRTLLYIFGGVFSCSQDETPLWIYNTDLYHMRQHSTDPGLPHPSGRRDHSAVMYRGAMFVYGGYIDFKGSTNEFWMFDCDTEDWELVNQDQPIEEVPGSRHGHTAVVYSGHMWLYGGMSDLLTRPDLWVWNFDTGRWSRIRSRSGPPPLLGHTASVIGDSMFILGGENSGQPQNDLWRFHFASRTWEKIVFHGNSFNPRSRHCTAVLVPRSESEQESSAVRSHSVPALRRPSRVNIQQLHRPRTSPSGLRIPPSSSSTVFHNRIFPGEQSSFTEANCLHVDDNECRDQIEAVIDLGGADGSCQRSGEVIELSTFSVVRDTSPLMEIQDSLGHSAQTGHDNPTFSPDIKKAVHLQNEFKLSRPDFSIASTSKVPDYHIPGTVGRSPSRKELEKNHACLRQKSSLTSSVAMREIPERRSFSADDLIIEDLEHYDSLTLLFKDIPNCDTGIQESSFQTECETVHPRRNDDILNAPSAVIDLNNSRGRQLCDNEHQVSHASCSLSMHADKSPIDDIQATMKMDHFSKTLCQPAENSILSPHWKTTLPSTLGVRESTRSYPGALQASAVEPMQRSPERASSYMVLDTAFIYVFGGREPVMGPLGRRPISVWKCEIPLS